MGVTVPRIGIACLMGYGLTALFVPAIVPQAGPPYDKALHFGFFFFAALLAGLSVRSRAGALLFGAILVLGGMLVEVAQGFAGAGRSAEYMDAAVNAGGALTAVILIALLRRGGSDGRGRAVLDAGAHRARGLSRRPLARRHRHGMPAGRGPRLPAFPARGR